MNPLKYDSYIKKFSDSFHNYKFRSLFFRYMRSIFTVFLVIIVSFSAIFYFTSINSRRNEYRLEAEKNIIAYANSFDFAIQRIEAFHNRISRENSMTLSLLRTYIPTEKEAKFSVQQKLLATELAEECAGNSLYSSIYVHLLKSGSIIGTDGANTAARFFDNGWIDITDDQKTVVTARFIPQTNCTVISIIKPLKIGGVTLGYICYNLRYEYFSRLFGNILESRSQNDMYILNADGQFVFSSDPEKLGDSIMDHDDVYGLYTFSADESEDFSARVVGDATSLCHHSYFEDMTLMYVSNHTGFAEASAEIAKSLLITVPVAIVLCALLSALISLRMYNYIFRILRFFDTSTAFSMEGDPGEIADIHRNIIDITSKSQSIETEFAQKLIELKKSQTVALQTQINPHFLLNTLQMICFTMIREQKGDSDSVKVISLLSDILRSNLNTRDYLVALGEELTLTEKYLQIELIRNGNMFNVEWDIDPATRERKILRFMLQPILENSILHGLAESRRKDKLIRISTRLERRDKTEALVIAIADNGSGMSPEMLAALQRQLEMNYMPENRGIGIMNVNMRLRLIFGDQAGMKIESQEGSGTIVTITLLSPPLDRNSVDNLR